MEIYRDGDVLALVGPLDGRCTAAVRQAVYDMLATHADGIVVDLGEVPWIDAPALNMLAMAAHHAEAEHRHLRLRGCSRHLRRVLQGSRLRSLFEIEGEHRAGSATDRGSAAG